MIPVAFLVVTLIGAALTFNAYRPVARRGRPAVFAFLAGWLVSELPIHHLFWQLLATGAFVAAGALRAWPGMVGLAITVASWFALLALLFDASRARELMTSALEHALGGDYVDHIVPALRDPPDPHFGARRLLQPFVRVGSGVERIANVPYDPSHGKRGLLDIYRRRDAPTQRPVLLQVHGGAWVLGSKDDQGLPLMNHLASLGWVCVAINYRLSPRASWPDAIVDVKRAITWVKQHIAEYGGDPNFVVITGGSAGGHLSSLAALTPNEPSYQPGFEDQDTTLQGCVAFYGVYDFINRTGEGNLGLRSLLERAVFKKRFDDAREAFDLASPMTRVNDAAPPFFVIHGTNDTLVPVAEARHFVALLTAASPTHVVYAELPGAQHAFEVFVSVRTAHTVRGVERFLAFIYSEHLAKRATQSDARH